MAITYIGDSSPSPASSSSVHAGTINTTSVTADQRFKFLPRVFGARHMMRGESAVYDWMAELCRNYQGGYWDFIDLSNGGFYLRLAADNPLDVVVAGNGFSGGMSPDAASIVATLFALNDLIWRGAGHLDDAYYLLRDFAAQHPEARLILQAID
jgi:hypothetical protein